MEIKPILTGKIHESYQLDSVTLEPSSLEISGPKEIIGQEDIVNTEPIDISGLQQTTVKQSALDIKPFIAEIIGEPVVSVRLNLIEKKTTRKIAGIPVEFARIVIAPAPELNSKQVVYHDYRFSCSHCLLSQPDPGLYGITAPSVGRPDGLDA